LSNDPGNLGREFDEIATRIEGYMKRFYLLSYCSPSRAGEHELKVEPFTADGKSGTVRYTFRADGFAPTCNPSQKPAFDLRKPRVEDGPGSLRRR
jgi:hypothetical protein